MDRNPTSSTTAVKGYKVLLSFDNDKSLYSIPSLVTNSTICGKRKKWTVGRKYHHRGKLYLCMSGYHMYSDFSIDTLATVYYVSNHVRIKELVICEAEGSGNRIYSKNYNHFVQKIVFQTMTITKILGRINLKGIRWLNNFSDIIHQEIEEIGKKEGLL